MASVDVLPGQRSEQEYDIPLVELRSQALELERELQAAMRDVLERGWYITGPRLQEFEARFAEYCGVQHAVGVATGTDAIYLVLRGLWIGVGDEVITVANTVYATARAIATSGASPVFVDIDPATGSIDPDRISAAVTSRTKAVVPVHLYGSPAALGRVLAAASSQSLAVIEDACQAAGAQYDGRRCGSFGHAGCFSFYPTKNLGGYGDGGMVVTNDASLAA